MTMDRKEADNKVTAGVRLPTITAQKSPNIETWSICYTNTVDSLTINNKCLTAVEKRWLIGNLKGLVKAMERLSFGDDESFEQTLLLYLSRNRHKYENLNSTRVLLLRELLHELGALVVPRSSNAFGLIPKSLSDSGFVERLRLNPRLNHLYANENNGKVLQNLFENKGAVMQGLVVSCLCELFSESSSVYLNVFTRKANVLDSTLDLSWNDLRQLPRVSCSVWQGRQVSAYATHMESFDYVSNKQNRALNTCENNYKNIATELSKAVTETLVDLSLLISVRTISGDPSGFNEKIRKTGYFVWGGEPLLKLPKQLALPMIVSPKKWLFIPDETGCSHIVAGGYQISDLSAPYVRGFVSTGEMHQHQLRWKGEMDYLNDFQAVAYRINTTFLDFLKNNKKSLVSHGLVPNPKWETSSLNAIAEEELGETAMRVMPVNHVQLYCWKKKMESKKQWVIENFADFFRGEELYWPIHLDFRGRIYRIGSLNHQKSSIEREMTIFRPSDEEKPSRLTKNSTLKLKFEKMLNHLVQGEAYHSWLAFFNRKGKKPQKEFENLLISGLKDGSLSWASVSGLLLLKEGKINEVSFNLDASASAYQIIGVINQRESLCEATNVLGSESLRDVYEIILKDLKEPGEVLSTEGLTELLSGVVTEPADEFKTLIECLVEAFDRKLIKNLIMPLIYGKTGSSYAVQIHKQVNEISKNRFVKRGWSYTLAMAIHRRVMSHSLIHGCTELSECLKAFVKLNNLVQLPLDFENSDFITTMDYVKLKTVQYRLYFRTSTGRRSQKVSVAEPVLKDGRAQRDETKSKTAVTANYIHFLDAIVCHRVIKAMVPNSIGTIHDCFVVRLKDEERVMQAYRNALCDCRQDHEKNLIRWIKNLQQHSVEPGNLRDIKTLEEARSVLGGIKESPGSLRGGLKEFDKILKHLDTLISVSDAKDEFLEKIKTSRSKVLSSL